MELKQLAPDFFKDKEIAKIEKLISGLSYSEVYKITLSKSQQILILKLFPEDYVERMNKEVKILKNLENYNIPSPRILFTDLDKRIIIENFIEGAPLYKSMKNKDVAEKLMKGVGEVLRRIHNIKEIEEWQDPTKRIKNVGEWVESVKIRNESNLKDLIDMKTINNFQKEKIEGYFKGFIKKLESSEVLLCPIHGDLNLNNILINKEEISGILDFEIHRVAHNLNDLGITYYWFKFYKKENLFSDILKGYSENTEEEIIKGYYIMQVIGALSFLTKNNLNKKAVVRLKEMLKEFLDALPN